jgi:hypothetical protein
MKAPKKHTQSKYPKVVVPAGTHIAVLYQIIDMGTQETEWQGQKKTGRKLRLTWEFPKKLHDFNGEQKPLVISKEVTFSMYEKASLRPIVEAMCGKSLSDKEADDFDISSIAGKACLLAVTNKKSEIDGNVYARIAGVTPIMEGMEAPKPFNPVVVYSVTEGLSDAFSKLPEWLQEKLVKAPEWDTNKGDDIPF